MKIIIRLLLVAGFLTQCLFGSAVSYAIWQKGPNTIICFGDDHSSANPGTDIAINTIINTLAEKGGKLFLECLPDRLMTTPLAQTNFLRALLNLAKTQNFAIDHLSLQPIDGRGLVGFQAMNFFQNVSSSGHTGIRNMTLHDFTHCVEQAINLNGYTRTLGDLCATIDKLLKQLQTQQTHVDVAENTQLASLQTKLTRYREQLTTIFARVAAGTPFLETLLAIGDTGYITNFIDQILFPLFQTLVETELIVNILENKATFNTIALYMGNNHIVALNNYLNNAGYTHIASQHLLDATKMTRTCLEHIQTQESLIFNPCAWCGSTINTSKCTRCLRTYYCSKTCQTKDWNLRHKKLCTSPATH